MNACKIVLLLVIGMSVIACKSDQNSDERSMDSQELASTNADGSDSEDPATQLPPLPSVCDQIEPSEIMELMDMTDGAVNEAAGNTQRSENAQINTSSCFWNWKGGGVMIQITRNPLLGELGNYADKFIEAKKYTGENKVKTKEVVKFKDFDGPGEQNIYNKDSAKFYMTKGQDFIVTVNFNGNFPNQMEVAKTLGERVLDSI